MARAVNQLICFYKNNTFLWSDHYELVTCEDHVPIKKFLEEIELKYFDHLKVVQLNFEYDQQHLYQFQKSLYTSSKANVFLLKEFQILNFFQLQNILNKNEIKNHLTTFESLTSRKEFIDKTNYIIEQIKMGRIYQVNLTAPLKAFTKLSSLDLFHHYQTSFSGAYKALIPLQHYNLISFSPELFLQKEGFHLKTCPIKGSLSSEKIFEEELIQNEKEDAELSMIVDLLRNDLNSLSDHHSSKVDLHRKQMQLGYIQHTYSEISVYNNQSFSSIVDKTFPGGSISGCPKIESLNVIREVEQYKRQAYTGALGWWQKNDFTLSLTIRSLMQNQDEVFYHSGCGIVYDSKPEDEWNEFVLKTGSLNVRK